MNPIMQLLNNQTSGPNGIFNLINFIRKSNNPQSAFQSMLSSNSQLQEVMKYIEKNGGDPRQAFYNLAEQKGVDPESILNQLR